MTEISWSYKFIYLLHVQTIWFLESLAGVDVKLLRSDDVDLASTLVQDDPGGVDGGSEAPLVVSVDAQSGENVWFVEKVPDRPSRPQQVLHPHDLVGVLVVGVVHTDNVLALAPGGHVRRADLGNRKVLSYSYWQD